MPAKCREGPSGRIAGGPPLSIMSAYISLGGYAVAGALGNRPLRHRYGTLGCSAISGPQQQCCHAVDDVEDVLADVREVALSQRLDALHGVVQEPELPLHRELERVQNVC